MKAKPFPRTTLLLATTLLLGGCARINDMGAYLMASDVPAYAVVGERLLTGRAVLFADRSGNLTLSAADAPALDCMGTLRYTSSPGGMISLRCSDGLQTMLPFTALTETSGHASGGTVPGTISLAYGLEPESTRAWLKPPAGKRLLVIVKDEWRTLKLE